MSQENVEVVRRMQEARAKGDAELSLSYFDPEVELSTPRTQPGGGTYHGREGVRRATVQWIGAWEDFEIVLEELTDLGEQVLVRISERGRGKGSGVDVDRQLFQLYTLRDRKILRVRMFETQDEALEAAGLSE